MTQNPQQTVIECRMCWHRSANFCLNTMRPNHGKPLEFHKLACRSPWLLNPVHTLDWQNIAQISRCASPDAHNGFAFAKTSKETTSADLVMAAWQKWKLGKWHGVNLGFGLADHDFVRHPYERDGTLSNWSFVGRLRISFLDHRYTSDKAGHGAGTTEAMTDTKSLTFQMKLQRKSYKTTMEKHMGRSHVWKLCGAQPQTKCFNSKLRFCSAFTKSRLDSRPPQKCEGGP